MTDATPLRTEQEIMDHVWDWFVVQGKGPSMGDDPEHDYEAEDGPPTKICFYLGENGCRCGAGCLLPLELTPVQLDWVKRCENSTICSDKVARLLWPLMRVGQQHLALLRGIQKVHDDAAHLNQLPPHNENHVPFGRGVRDGLIRLALQHGLTTKETL